MPGATFRFVATDVSAVQPFAISVKAKSWGDEVLVACTSEYTGKVLHRYGREPYHRFGLQYHPDRDESVYLATGAAWLYFVNGAGVLCKTQLEAGMSVHIPRGAVHSFETIGDSVVFETSTPSTTPAIRVEDEYDVTTAVVVDPVTLEAIVCERCHSPGKSSHECPFKMDIHGSDEPCTCCEGCEYECTMDI